ncbi:Pectate lyase superfamily protein [compost metagenome]
MNVRKFNRTSLIGLIVVIVMFFSAPFATLVHADATGGVINVKDLGAKGDGKTDDTAVVQQALDRAANQGASVYFPKGTYLVDPGKTLIVESRTKIVGDGTGSVIQASGSKFGWEMMRATGSNIEINSIVLDGNMAVNRVLAIGGGSSAIKVSKAIVSNASHSKDPGNDFHEGVVSGIIIYGNSSNIEIDSVEVKNINAVNLTSGSLISRGIYVTTTWGSKETVAAKVSITNSYIHHIGPADDGDGIYYEDPNLDNNKGKDTGSFIVNNRFDHNAKRAIKLYAQGITVKDNKITNSFLKNNYYAGKEKGKLAPDMFAGISVYGSNNVIENNTIGGVGSYYAAIEVSAEQTVNNVTVKGNKIVMGASSSTQGTTAIRLGNTKDFHISGNTIENAEKGIWTWQNAEKGSIENNVIQTTKGGIDLTTYLDNCTQKDIVVQNNKVTGDSFNIQLAKSNVNVKVIGKN